MSGALSSVSLEKVYWWAKYPYIFSNACES